MEDNTEVKSAPEVEETKGEEVQTEVAAPESDAKGATGPKESVFSLDDDDFEDDGGEGDGGAAEEDEAAAEERQKRKEKVLRKLEQDHLNVVFIGHVDAGKSTTAGNILVLTGQVDERTIEKYEKAAKDTNRSSWFLAFIMDVNDDERAKGITVEVGRASFQTEKRRFTVLDAPGHKNYVPNMISGACQADVAILVITARRGEFEAGFEKGGQTREHALLAVTLGVTKLIVFVNKMDESTVNWSKERYDEIVSKVTSFIKVLGFRRNDVFFLPGSGLTGLNLKDRVSKDICPWYDGPSMFEILDNMSLPPRSPDGPLRIPVLDKIREGGKVWYMGKIESGTVRVGGTVMMQPGRMNCTVAGLNAMEVDIDECGPGENIRILLNGANDDHVHAGSMVCDAASPVRAVTMFEGQIQIIDVLAHKPIISPGYRAVIHAHTASMDCTIESLVSMVNKSTRQPDPKKPRFAKKDDLVNVRISTDQAIALDLFRELNQTGRFTLRDEGQTIAIGRVMKLPKDKN